ncbi:methyltransferase domain-containing protein [Actinomadura viridis]|uniref:23S rRNA G2445 N2-methylase RlmL n=1 Tax=Actinomadura viridis TaxID=58110 RepID=A0A931GKX2_9ACTN|nr:methyltransferase domain-containing protein [Actinomadura viridis]MBG6091368.1 23S rRNA G2445 N2-methylase RlmL [Actinomadura viridis]
MTATRLVARCVRGLEPTLAAEVLRHELGTILHLGHREVHFRPRRPPEEAALALRTADDLFLLTARMPDIGPAKADVGRLTALADSAAPPGPAGGIEVSASFLGRRNYNRYDAEDAVGRALAGRLGAPYHSRRSGDAPPPSARGWRLILDGTTATLMLRVADRPLHRRPYKHLTIPGTLHPPVAAAMAQLAGIQPGHTVLDPCCGAGTLLIEAAHLHPDARFQGFDNDPAALQAARTNAEGVPRLGLRRGDAGALPLRDASADRVLCNPPWGAQVTPSGTLARHPARWWAELSRVLTPDGTAVVLIPDPGALTAAIANGLTPVHLQQVRLSGAHSHIVQLTGASRLTRSRRR